ncbi:MAG: polyphosphate kinase 1 [Mesosutterella sp.]|nr:polyphosphate kinase 1 [Mesosutterella sp.]
MENKSSSRVAADKNASASPKTAPRRAKRTVRASGKAAGAKKDLPLTSPSLYTNRELSWLSFNRRVLETALEEDRPLLDQVKFLSIFYTNLDEFFMVRVSNIFKQYQTGASTLGPDKMSPAKQLAEIRKLTMEQVEAAASHWINRLQPALAEAGVRVVEYSDLDPEQQKYLLNRFKNDIYPILTPQAIDPGHPFPKISNLSINFLIEVADSNDVRHYARLRVPHNIPRFYFVPRNPSLDEPQMSGSFDKSVDIVQTEKIIGEFLPLLFPGYKVTAKGMFRITRNTDVEIEEDEADDLLEAVRDSVLRRRFGGVVRLETEYRIPAKLTSFLVSKLHLLPSQIYTVKGPMAFSGFMQLNDLNIPALKDTPYYASYNPATQPVEELFENIAREDILLYHPYQTFTSVVDFVQQAARDPKVLGIKMTLYRVGNNSPIVKALMDARMAGKQVTAVVELKARFDEERNINWAEEMEHQNVNVVYGFVGLKVHAKLCLVIRREDSGIRTYVHIGTGNYNPGSAKNYTDLGLLTADPAICSDVTDLFNVMTGYAKRTSYNRLLVSPTSMRSGLERSIRAEIERHRREGNGRIVIKCNQLVDADMIKLLYEASIAGVKVDCLVRGICCLKPGIPGVSENITVRAILGKFLEHARVYWFGPLEDTEKSFCYIGSADMMGRNLDRRIEVVTPILGGRLKKRLAEEVLQLQLADNQRTWLLEKDTYTRIVKKPSEKSVNAQEELIRRYGE